MKLSAPQHSVGDIALTMVCDTCAPKSSAPLITRVIFEILPGRICIAAINDQSLLRP
jgi:hypothetical protein